MYFFSHLKFAFHSIFFFLTCKSGANCNERDAATQSTAIMWAAASGLADTIRVLIRGGANPNLINTSQRTGASR